MNQDFETLENAIEEEVRFYKERVNTSLLEIEQLERRLKNEQFTLKDAQARFEKLQAQNSELDKIIDSFS